jgi:signal transduction histidine kinase
MSNPQANTSEYPAQAQGGPEHVEHVQHVQHVRPPVLAARGLRRTVLAPFLQVRGTLRESSSSFLAAPGKRRDFRMPPWMRPFWSVRTQLSLVYALLLVLVVLLLCLFIMQGIGFSLVLFAAALLICLGGIAAAVITGLLLRPLQRVTDAAQAIALGDFEQRERLLARTPPQDEFDRLAGSIHEMVLRLERADEVQRASERSFRHFFAEASHQLRTPLTSLRGFTEILMRFQQDGQTDAEMIQHVLSRMRGEAERMTYLINDLLTLARLDDVHPLRLNYVDLEAIARDRLAQLQAQVEDGRVIKLERLTQEDLGIAADEECLKQLLFVLLDNALKYGRAGADGLLTLQLDKKDNKVIIKVTDNGEGIGPEDLKHIFDAFYRGKYRKNAEGAPIIGTGLGLTIAATIVRAHKGTITAQSEAQGTTFTVILPSSQ